MANGFYTVQPGDVSAGLLEIARRYYGDATRWPAIYEANRAVIGYNPQQLRAGQQLVLPDLVPDGQSAAPPRLYRVELRDLADGLGGIAARLWGDRERWREVYALNRGVIGDDPAALLPGQWLLLP
jgi:nucleoid-associated protein YgaU